eukprot:gnl/MRDRNA2_/MRDRNA2_85981_c0_seq10.p3 gnl/MRDRNA2_/MRDRNA2_85981_c0~~gnl/MRDRNA2_/MRDRNA2_85981_c0_seq10.p3  ORF type:complete len:101 (+),score=22.37 gnl/MRDRNA2_/MRDRNA2_85981_c0_seq10:945-1247(+)
MHSIHHAKIDYAALEADGSVVASGDCSEVQDQLATDVEQICASGASFAALKADGSLVTWGAKSYGGDSSHVAQQLQSVCYVIASDRTFAAVRFDGEVVTW